MRREDHPFLGEAIREHPAERAEEERRADGRYQEQRGPKGVVGPFEHQPHQRGRLHPRADVRHELPEKINPVIAVFQRAEGCVAERVAETAGSQFSDVDAEFGRGQRVAIHAKGRGRGGRVRSSVYSAKMKPARPPNCLRPWMARSPLGKAVGIAIGGSRIRTHGEGEPHGAFQEHCLKPLGHPSRCVQSGKHRGRVNSGAAKMVSPRSAPPPGEIISEFG